MRFFRGLGVGQAGRVRLLAPTVLTRVCRALGLRGTGPVSATAPSEPAPTESRPNPCSPQPWLIRSAARSDVGLVRRENQDAYGMFPELGLYLVADGVGGHAGGSRVYRLRAAAVEQLTDDHTLVHEWVSEGKITAEDAASSPHRHIITQAVGTKETLAPSLRLERLLVGDVFVLTSDGIHDL